MTADENDAARKLERLLTDLGLLLVSIALRWYAVLLVYTTLVAYGLPDVPWAVVIAVSLLLSGPGRTTAEPDRIELVGSIGRSAAIIALCW